MYTVIPATARQPVIRTLIAALDAWQSECYPQESNHLLDLSELPASTLALLAIRHESGETVGCGAVVLNGDGTGEIKRVYIDARHRGQKLGELLITALETAALARGCHTLRLETGIKQPAAITLYGRCGYQQRSAFAPYADDPLSIFMEKDLSDRHSAGQ
ncbi:GNAT family N-acetyltransferase [Yokenella regensburgei]|uniref:GNAT family N-acetyltransferase n=1 Tax=Yokenella regensburgei TaxID=158877 RepID=UPI003F13CCB7